VRREQSQKERDECRQARDEERLQTEQRHVRQDERAARRPVVQFTDIGRRAQSGREAHFEVALEIAYHGNEDEELVDPPKDSPAREVFEQFTGKDETDQADEEGWCCL
jgi:hypothetical protein